MKIIRTLEWYEKDGIELIGEKEISITINQLEAVFGAQNQDPDFYDKYEILPQHLDQIKEIIRADIELHKYCYLIACYKEN